jgi:polyisoprenoid-binding protein YceI
MIRAWAGGLCLAGLVWATALAAPMPEIFDPAASRASFDVSLRVMGVVHGRFHELEGELQPKGELWRVAVRLDARALDLDGPAWMVRATRSDKFLDVERHPDIRFESETFARELLAKGGELRGKLRLRGRTRPVTFRVEPSGCKSPGRTCDIHVHGSVSRRDFGMNAQRVWVKDEVDFDFRVRLQPMGR